MVENKEQNIKPKIIKKKSRLKSILYLALIVILIVIISTIYFKIKVLIGNNKAKKVATISTEEKSKNSEDSINTSMLNEYLQKQQDFQKEVSQKILDLGKRIENKNVNNNKGSNVASRNKIAELEAKLVDLNNKKDYTDNFSIVYNLITSLSSNTPFLNELNTFSHSSLSKKYEDNIKAINNVASRGIPNNYELVNSLNSLIPKIKIASYKLDTTIWGRIKYYLSFVIVVQKSDHFNENNVSLDNTLNEIKLLLLDNNTESALSLVNKNNLCKLSSLATWCQDLNDRVEANDFILKLQQYLLSKQTVEK